MNYIDTELLFIARKNRTQTVSKSFGDPAQGHGNNSSSELLGINLRLGCQPLVYSLEALSGRSGKPSPLAQSAGQDYYLVVHAISAIRTQGTAKVEELQYFATASEPAGLQTIDLIPKSRFNELVNVGVDLFGALDLFGEVSLDIPTALTSQLLTDSIDIAAGVQLQLSASARFIGKFTYSLQIPIVQSSGIGSGYCTWILKPNEKKEPLLGDQLLIQSLAVPKGTKTIKYSVSGLIKADKGIFWKQQQKKTPDYVVEIDLEQIDKQRV